MRTRRLPRRALAAASALLGSVLVAVATAVPAAEPVTAIRAGAVFDPTTGRFARDQVVVVEGQVIRAVGPAGSVAIPGGAKVVDLSRQWLLPGLIDAHTHLTLTEITNGPFESFYLTESTAARALRGLANAQDMLRSGFTTVRDIGNEAEYAMVDVGRAIEAGRFQGPTVIAAGKIIAPFGGQSHDMPRERGPLWQYEYLDADTPDEVRKAIRRNIYYGSRVVKLVTDNNPYHSSLEELKAAVDEAHHAGLPVAVHTYGGEAADNAIEAGVDSIEHGFYLTDAQLSRMKAKGIFLCSTDFPRAHLDVIGTSGGILPPPAELAPKIVDRLKRAQKIGVRLVFGSDTVMDVPGRTRGDLVLDYVAVWREAGVPPATLLKAMTSEAAELLRIGDRRGRIAVGLQADLVALPINPLEDTEALRRVSFVMKDGRVVRDDGPAPH